MGLLCDQRAAWCAVALPVEQAGVWSSHTACLGGFVSLACYVLTLERFGVVFHSVCVQLLCFHASNLPG